MRLSSHRSIFGSAVGLGIGLFLAVINAPIVLLLLAPLVAGIVSGSVGGGAKAGLLTLLFGVIIAVPLATALTPPNGSVPDLGQTSGIGIVGGTLAALTNGMLGSAQAIMGGFAALMSGLGQILFILVLLSLIVAGGVALVVSTAVGAVGGLIGRVFRGKQLAKQNVTVAK